MVLLMPTVGASTTTLTIQDAQSVTSYDINISGNDIDDYPSSSLDSDLGGSKTYSSLLSTQDVSSNETPLQVNVIEDPGFEEYESSCPSSYICQGSGLTSVNFSHSTDTHAGSYAAEMKSKGYLSSITMSLYQYPTLPVFLNESVTFSFWFNIKKNPALHGYGYPISVYSYVYLINTTSYTSHQVNYHLSYNALYGENSSTDAVYALNTTTFGSWISFQRNVTLDVLETFGDPSSLGTLQVSSIYFTIRSSLNSAGFVDAVIDDVSLVNGTGHEFLDNGDFESGDGTGWRTSSPYSPGLLEKSVERVEGLQSLNMTAHTWTNESYSHVIVQKYFSASSAYYWFENQASGREILKFNWYYDDGLINDSGYDAYLEVGVRNVTSYYYFRWYMGVGNDSFSFSNSSTTQYMKASSFGSRGSWHQEEINLSWLSNQFSLGSFYLTNIRFQVEGSRIAGGKITLLIDNVTLIANPLGDSSFEAWGFDTTPDNLVSWGMIGSNSVSSLSNTSFTGEHALNMTAGSSVSARVYRSFSGSASSQLLDVNTYTDFWWKINDMSVADSSSTYLVFWLQDESTTRYLYYVLAADDSWLGLIANTSTNVYLLVNHFNTTGDWHVLRRSIGRDVDNYFGDVNVTITRLEAWVISGTNSSISVLFDGFSFVHDTHPPIIHQVTVTPPQYFENASILINASDMYTESLNIEVRWSINSSAGQWMNRDAVQVERSVYSVTLPVYPYNTRIIFYVTATDLSGNAVKEDNGGLNHTFTVTDEVSPEMVIIAPRNGSVMNGTMFFAMQASDEGSGIQHVSLLVDGETSYQENESSFILAFNTTSITNGTHVFTFKAVDNAGNARIVRHEYIIANPSPKTTSTTTSEVSENQNSTVQSDSVQQVSQNFSNFMREHGFFVGLLTVPILWIFYKLIRRRFRR